MGDNTIEKTDIGNNSDNGDKQQILPPIIVRGRSHKSISYVPIVRSRKRNNKKMLIMKKHNAVKRYKSYLCKRTDHDIKF